MLKSLSWLIFKGLNCGRTGLSFFDVSGTLGLGNITMILLWGAKLRKQISKLTVSSGQHLPTQAQQIASRRCHNFQSGFGRKLMKFFRNPIFLSLWWRIFTSPLNYRYASAGLVERK